MFGGRMLVGLVHHIVDGDRERDHQRGLRLIKDFDAVTFADGKPFLGNIRNRLIVTRDVVLMVKQITLRHQVLTAGNLDIPLVTQNG